MDASYGLGMSGRGRSSLTVNAGSYTWCPALDYLADGVTSSVYRCRERQNGDFFAVKVFKGRPPPREVELLKKLKHENIVRLITEVEFKDETGSKCGLVLEYCSGNSLHEYLKKPRNKLGLHDSDFLTLLYNMCDGLAYLRQQLQIVHRDIKPGNIMISYDNRRQPVFKLADFGSSRELQDDGDFQSLVGTYEFLHPSIYTEVYNRMHAGMQQRDTTAAGHKPECDLWSLGVTLYMAATGRLPFSPYEGVRCNHAQMINMMTNKPPLAISATQEVQNGPVQYHDRLPSTCQLSERLQQLLVTLLQGILVCEFKVQWTFAKFFETVNVDKSQYPTYYFMAGCMLRPNLVFSAKQTLESLLCSLAETTGYARDEIVVFYRSQVVSAFPTGSTHTNPVIVLSRQNFNCTLDMTQLDFGFVKSRPSAPKQVQPKEIKDYIDEAHKQALACQLLARTCHLNHALTLEAKDAILSLMRTRGRESFQRASAKIAMVSSTQQKVGRLIELAKLIGAQTQNSRLLNEILEWQRIVDAAGDTLKDFKPEGRDSMDSGSSSSCGGGSLVLADELTNKFEVLFAKLDSPLVEAECMSVAFYRVEQVHERYAQMITKYAQKDASQLSELMQRSFQFDRSLLDRCLDDCQNAARVCCVETLTSVRNRLAEWMLTVQDEVNRLARLEESLMQETEATLDLLHDRIFSSINEALKIYFIARNSTNQADISTLTASIHELVRSCELVHEELDRNTMLLRELDQLGLQNSGLSSIDTEGSNASV